MNEDGWQWYSANRQFQHHVGVELLSLWKDDWSAEEVVLDVGCGTGELTKLIGERSDVKTIIGIDVSAKAIELARQRNHIEGKTKYLVADLGNIQETHSELGNAFTKVYSNMALHWMENPEKLFKNVCWCLKQRGTFVFDFEKTDEDCKYDYICENSITHPRWESYLKDFRNGAHLFDGGVDEMGAMASRAGFKTSPRGIEVKRRDLTLDTFEKFEECAKPVLGQLNLIPPDLHRDFLEDCFAMFRDVAPTTEDGKPYYLYRSFVCKLEK